MSRLLHKNLAGINLVGFSLAGEETVIAAPELNVCFDIGRAPREVISIDNVCLSHGHMDHAAGVAYYFSQRTFIGNKPGRLIVHRGMAQAFQRLMEVWSDIERHPSPGQVYGVESLEDVPLRRGLIIRPFTVNHGACALGYSLIESRHKLKAEYHGLSGPQLVELKKQGIAIEETLEVTLITYTGDTALGKWMEHDFVRRTQALIVECTFFDRDHLSRAREGKHIHVDDLPKVLEAVPEAQVMIAHTTRRNDLRQVKRTVERRLSPADRERTSFLMDRPPRPRDPQPTPPAASDTADRPASPATTE